MQPLSNDWKRRFWHLTYLNILSNFTIPLVGLADTGMLGQLPDLRFLGGVALGSLVFEYVYWTLGFLRMSTTGLTAQALGRSEHREEYLVLYRALLIGLILGSLILLLQSWIREAAFVLLSGTTGVEEAGRDYFNARIWAAPATLCNFAILGWFLGRGQSQHVLLMTLVTNLCNILLNYVFILRLDMAAGGAGLATTISQYLMLALGTVLVLRQGTPASWRHGEFLKGERFRTLISLNRDIFIRTLCLVTAFALFTNGSALLGTTLLAANAILLRLLMLAAFAIDGIAFAVETLGGALFGSRAWRPLQELYRYSLFWSAVCGFVFGLLFLLTAPWFIPLLTVHVDVQRETAALLPWLILTVTLGALAFALDGLFLGLTQGKALRNAVLFSLLGAFLPPLILSTYLHNVHLLWLGMVLFMAARGLSLWMAFRRLRSGWS